METTENLIRALEYVRDGLHAQADFNSQTTRTFAAVNRLDDYRGQQIAALEARLDALATLVQAFVADPDDVAAAVLRRGLSPDA
jgi:hypothetical protein